MDVGGRSVARNSFAFFADALPGKTSSVFEGGEVVCAFKGPVQPMVAKETTLER